MNAPARTAVLPLPAGREHRLGAASMSALLGLACLARFGLNGEGAVAAFLAIVLVVISAIDLERRIIPNRIVIPATAIVLVAQTALNPDRALEWAVAAVGAACFFLVPLLIHPTGLGMGDVKLAALLGAGLGAAVVGALVVGILAAAAVALVILVRGGAAARKRAIPFGPFLAFGAVVALLFL